MGISWIEVDHWPPDECVDVLVSFIRDGERHMAVAYYYMDRHYQRVWAMSGGTLSDGMQVIPTPTHWATMPAHPR